MHTALPSMNGSAKTKKTSLISLSFDTGTAKESTAIPKINTLYERVFHSGIMNSAYTAKPTAPRLNIFGGSATNRGDHFSGKIKALLYSCSETVIFKILPLSE